MMAYTIAELLKQTFPIRVGPENKEALKAARQACHPGNKQYWSPLLQKKVSVMAGNWGSLLQHWATQKHKVQRIPKMATSKCWIKTNHLPRVNIEERFFQDHCNSLHRSSPHMAKPRLRNQGWLEELLVKRWEQKLPGVSGKNPPSTYLPTLLTKGYLNSMLAYSVDTLAFYKNRLFFSHYKKSRGNCGVSLQARTRRVPLGRCKLAQNDGMGLHLKQCGTKLLARKPKNAWMNMKPDTGEADKKD